MNAYTYNRKLSRMFYFITAQVVSEGASGVRTSAVPHPMSVSRARDVLRPEVASTNGLISPGDRSAVAENPAAAAHAQDRAETVTEEV